MSGLATSAKTYCNWEIAMTIKSNLFIAFVSILSTSHGYAMLCAYNQVQRCVRGVRHTSTAARTVKEIYDDALKIGDTVCSKAYTTSDRCKERGCFRFPLFSAKWETKDYMELLECQFRSKHYCHGSSFEVNLKTHNLMLREQFRQLCSLEKEVLALMQRTRKNEMRNNISSVMDVSLFKKTLTMTTHKKRCIRTQVKVIETSLLGRPVQEMEEEDLFKVLYAGEEVLVEFKTLCCELFSWQHNLDKMVVYTEPTNKE
jgi:hypothetical protein